MTIEELAVQGRKRTYTTSAERNYDNIYKMRNKALISAFGAISQTPNISAQETHRNNKIATINGVNYIDDSYSFTTNATWFTLYQSTKQVIWILKSLDEELDLKSIFSTIKEKVSNVIIVKSSNDKDNQLKAQLSKLTQIIEVNSIKEAVKIAYNLASNDNNVIFSPASGNEEKVMKEYDDFSSSVFDL
jgi:UDP-N-acetylmuramoylalanine--D-glutamate ligase